MIIELKEIGMGHIVVFFFGLAYFVRVIQETKQSSRGTISQSVKKALSKIFRS